MGWMEKQKIQASSETRESTDGPKGKCTERRHGKFEEIIRPGIGTNEELQREMTMRKEENNGVRGILVRH
jgi:hypothetical protein